ncbi:MAG TPA: hypothetical protein VIL36_22795 [Acidimicrobiales bacterium]
MSAAATLDPGDAPGAPNPTRAPSRAWGVFTSVLTAAIFLQAVTAGRLLSGDDWARDAHHAGAGLTFLAALVGAVVAGVRLRGVDAGRRLALLLAVLGVALLVQFGLGSASADGRDTLWIHVPLGVAIVGLAGQVASHARRLATVPA